MSVQCCCFCRRYECGNYHTLLLTHASNLLPRSPLLYPHLVAVVSIDPAATRRDSIQRALLSLWPALTCCTLLKYALACVTSLSSSLRSLSCVSATLANVVMASLHSAKRWPSASNSPCISDDASRPTHAAIFATVSRSSKRRSFCVLRLSWQTCEERRDKEWVKVIILIFWLRLELLNAKVAWNTHYNISFSQYLVYPITINIYMRFIFQFEKKGLSKP